jgi:glutathione S-transferase
MKLHWSPRSPYVRKVMIAAHELGIADRIVCIRSVASTTKPNDALMQDSPLSKIPVLVLDDGQIILDSPVISEYLDLTYGDGRLLPRTPAPRIETLSRQALGDGMLDIQIAWRGEMMRPQPQQSEPHLHSYGYRTRASLDQLDRTIPNWPASRFDVGDIAIGVALSYLDFRFTFFDWRAGHPALSAWYQAFAQRPSVRAVPVVDEPSAA